MVRNRLWFVNPGIKIFSRGKSKGHLQNQGDSILFLIHEVCFTVPFEVVITSVSKVRGCRKHVKKVHGWYIYFDSKPNISTTDKGIYSDEEQQPSLIQKNIPSEYSSLSGSKVQELEEEQQVKLNRTPQEYSSS